MEPIAVAADALFEHPMEVRYMEVDQQGVVFNGWYLTYFDQAMMHFLAARGVPYQDMMARGYDVQLIHNQTTWGKAVRWLEPVTVAVSTSRFGTTSFDLDFSVRVDGDERVTGRTTYVVVATDGSGKRPIPDFLRAALEPAQPLLDR